MSLPSTTTLPAVGSMRRSTSRAKVDLPDPLSPTSPRVVPAMTSRSTPSTARTAPVLRRSTPLRRGNSFTRSVTVITGSTLVFAAAGSTNGVAATSSRAPDSGARPVGRSGTGSPASSGSGPVTDGAVAGGSFDRLGATERNRSGQALVLGVGATGSEPTPVEELVGPRHHTGNGVQRFPTRRELRHRVQQRLGVGVPGGDEDVAAIDCSTICPAYMTTTSSATSAMTPRSWVTKIIAMSSSRWRVWSRSMICAWVVTSRAVVGSSAISSLGEHDSAMAIITR